MDSKNSPVKKQKLPMIDHGIDIIGDEWEDEEEEWASNEVNTDALQNEENWEDEADVRMIYNDAQMINGSFEGDTISQKGKKILEKRKEKKK